MVVEAEPAPNMIAGPEPAPAAIVEPEPAPDTIVEPDPVIPVPKIGTFEFANPLDRRFLFWDHNQNYIFRGRARSMPRSETSTNPLLTDEEDEAALNFRKRPSWPKGIDRTLLSI